RGRRSGGAKMTGPARHDAARVWPTARCGAFGPPFLRAPEGARTVFLVTIFAVTGPLAGGLAIFGWRAGVVVLLSVLSCVVVEELYYRVTRIPALLGRTHAVLTGLLLAMTLPAFVPWFVPIVAAAFAIIVGKAVFGGVGHFLWQPALVGRLAVAVLLPAQLTIADGRYGTRQPVLAANRLLLGDVRNATVGRDEDRWRGRPAPPGRDAVLLTSPTELLRGLARRRPCRYAALVYRPPDSPPDVPAALLQMPPIENLIYGARPGGIGETSVVLIIVAGLYLIYRNYLKWPLPGAMLAAAWLTAALSPVYLAGPDETVRTCWPVLLSPEGPGVALTYINYQLLGGELLLAVLLVAAETTSRPVTTGGQTIFALACGALAMALQIYTDVPIPCFMAVLAMNTLTPTIDRLWRPRVAGTRRFRMPWRR
ncbi:MAG: RnfABCDGE type electron transport complex subunit D, partial [Planctomycetes bacterium]|nr:RnfABCDGE type electron transport complex subunit D [Planctomycetota bacterium]